jgi:hypothetical protein
MTDFQLGASLNLNDHHQRVSHEVKRKDGKIQDRMYSNIHHFLFQFLVPSKDILSFVPRARARARRKQDIHFGW